MGEREDYNGPEELALRLARARCDYKDAKDAVFRAQQECAVARARLVGAQQRYEQACAKAKAERAPQPL